MVVKERTLAGPKAAAWESGEEVLKSKGDMVFCSLHHHSTFSYLDGFGTPEQHVLRGAELGMYAMASTDHGNVTAHAQWEQAADKHGVKPLFGCELYCGDIGENATMKKNHLTVIAENQIGYSNLLRMVSRAWAEGFYYQPTVNGSLLREQSAGLIVLSGCQGSLLATSLVGGKNIEASDASYARGKGVARRFWQLFGDRYYLEVQAFPELEATNQINAQLAQLSDELKVPLVATLDAHYTTPDEGQMQAILHSVRSGAKKTAEELAQSWGYDVPLCPLTDQEIIKRLEHTGLSKRQAQGAVRNSRVISERCNVRLPKVENLRYPLPPDMDAPIQLFRRWLNEGWKYRRFHLLTADERAEYTARVKYEMGLIEEKGFVDYFLVMADATKFAKDRGIPVGPARGSAAASLVCYLLRITEVNPMQFPTLVFERFIDKNRFDLPDIDLDFDDERRHEVREYLVSKYGADRVGNVGTFTKYKGKNCLNDVQMALYRDDWEVKHALDDVKDLIIERKVGDLRSDATLQDTAELFPKMREVFERWPDMAKAYQLEGNTRGMSVHAAGLVVANEPLDTFCATYTRRDAKGHVIGEVISLDKYDAEYLNAMKIDALGLKTMAMIRICLELIGMTLEELYALPLDDPKTLKGFQDGDLTGIFQFDGATTQQVNFGVKPQDFSEIADVIALARPGPLHGGATAEYIDIKHGKKQPTHYHELVDAITAHTHYQIVYQEQILQICREIGGFSWAEAARIRQIISKKRGQQEFNTMKSKFVEGAASKGIDETNASVIWAGMVTSGSYAFVAAHTVSYGLIAYWTQYLKQHHPTEFFVACLRKFDDKVVPLLRDAQRHGIDHSSVNLDSKENWSIDTDNDVLRAGWIQVPGIGEVTANRIVDYERTTGLQSWKDLLAIKGIGAKTLESLQLFAEEEDPFGIHYLENKLGIIRNVLRKGVSMTDDDGTFKTPGAVYTLPRPTHKSEDIPYDKTQQDIDVVWLGVITKRNTKDLFESHYSQKGVPLDPDTVKRPDLNEWVTMTGEDETGDIHISINRFVYPQWKEDVWSIDLENDAVLIRGRKWHKISRRMIFVEYLWVLED
jgi:DNA polymerase-3 subunit alpha